MNRHFRVPPEHQELWMEIKKAIAPYIVALGFCAILIVASILAVIHYT